MKAPFHIGVCTDRELLTNQPPQFRHTNLIFTPFGIRVGERDFPASFWTDFAGASLFKWCRAVWCLSYGEVRAARLTFSYTYEFWLRKTTRHWWRLSLVERKPDSKQITYEALVLLPILGPPSYVFDLPLLYGMCYSGGNLAYQFEHSDISVLVSPGTLADDWPYSNYPPILPYVPLAVTKRKKQSWREFAAEFPNMKDDQPSDLVVLVPPPMTIGVSLWGREGDAEGVTMVFECDLKEKKVTAYNVCT